MKTRILISSLLSVMTLTAFAQQVENDDMYFNSRDRQKFREAQASGVTMTSSRAASRMSEVSRETSDTNVNPTDSYSARNTNPEYSARSNAEIAVEDNQDYFIQDYRLQSYSRINNFNNDFNRWYGNSWYNSRYYSPGIYGWNSPYYGGAYSNFGNPWHNPYFQSGWSSSFSFYWGNNWDYGWGNSWNYGYPYGDPWGMGYASMYSPFYSPYSYYGGRFGYRYPTVVVVDNDYYDRQNYSRRNSRSSYMSRTVSGSNNRIAPSSVSNSGRGSRSDSGGRVAGDGNSREGYYNRSWRTQTTSPSSTGTTVDPNSTGRTRSSSWSGSNSNSNSNSNRSWNTNSNTNRSNTGNSTYTPSRSSSSPSYNNSGGSRSSGSSGGSSSGGSGSRSSRGR